MPKTVEIGIQSFVVNVAEEVGFLPPIELFLGLGFLKPFNSGDRKISIKHLAGFALAAARHSARDGEEQRVGSQCPFW